MAVDEKGVGRTRHVRHIGWVHPHLAPVHPLLERLVAARQQPGERLLLVVEVARLLLELQEDRMRVHRAVVRKDDHMFAVVARSEEHTSELQSLMRISYAVFCLKKKQHTTDKLYIQYTPIH